MAEPPLVHLPLPPHRSWRKKFTDAFRGLRQGVHRQSSFAIHFLFAAAVIALAAALGMGSAAWALLAVSITLVFTAEMFNSALEAMARAITDQWSPHLESALNIGSAAVLLGSRGGGDHRHAGLRVPPASWPAGGRERVREPRLGGRGDRTLTL